MAGVDITPNPNVEPVLMTPTFQTISVIGSTAALGILFMQGITGKHEVKDLAIIFLVAGIICLIVPAPEEEEYFWVNIVGGVLLGMSIMLFILYYFRKKLAGGMD